MHSIIISSQKNKFQRLWVFFQIQILGFSKLIYIFTNDIVNYRGVLAAPTQKEMELYEKWSQTSAFCVNLHHLIWSLTH